MVGIQVLATFGGLRIPNSGIQSHHILSKRSPHPFLSKLGTIQVGIQVFCYLPGFAILPNSGIQSRPILSKPLAKPCPSSDQAPPFSDQAPHDTVLAIYVFVYFRGSEIPPKFPFYKILKGENDL